MSAPQSYADFKALVYGLGRAVGIRVSPRRHAGADSERILALALDVVGADKSPPDPELGAHAIAAAVALHNAVSVTSVRPQEVALALQEYVAARTHNPTVIVEHD
jgi:hypothetical protein